MPTLETSTIIKRELVSPPDSVEKNNEDFITVNKAEYQILKKRYSIVKTTLESVLHFIVPQNLRNLVNKTIKEIKESDASTENF
jgi:hypothetical protein